MNKEEKKEEIKIIEKLEKPMGDDDIRKYLPNPKIITNKELLKINDIDELFDPKNYVDYYIILFLDAPNKGHWTALLKYGDKKKGIIEFFDSYGGTPDKVYDYCPLKIRQQLGTNSDHLCLLLSKVPYDVIYNPIKYQAENNEEFDVNTCGRHCTYRIMQLLYKGRTLPEYYEYMSEAKKFYAEPYDLIVSKLISK